MALVRIFLLTYKRPQLLQRSLKSLLAQTFTDWVCELHNHAHDAALRTAPLVLEKRTHSPSR